MSRKPPVDVDEDSIRNAMMDVPRGGHFTESAPPKSETVPKKPVPQVTLMEQSEPTDSEPKQILPAVQTVPKESEPAKRGPYRKRKTEEEQAYRDLFLVNDGVCSRVSTYINRDIHEKFKRLLSNAAPGISIVSYINNILNHHLDQHHDLIEGLYRSGYDKPF